MDKDISLTIQELEALAQYLAKQPYQEVAGLLDMIQAAAKRSQGQPKYNATTAEEL